MKTTNKQIANTTLSVFQMALDANAIKLESSSVCDELKIHFDTPMNQPRFTYSFIDENNKVKSMLVAVMSDNYKGTLCLDIGIATSDKYKGKGFAKKLIESAIKEMKCGFNRNGLGKFYLEFKVDTDNTISHKLCKPLADDTIIKKDATIYLKLVE